IRPVPHVAAGPLQARRPGGPPAGTRRAGPLGGRWLAAAGAGPGPSPPAPAGPPRPAPAGTGRGGHGRRRLTTPPPQVGSTGRLSPAPPRRPGEGSRPPRPR